ncbi:MAG TPA: lmo0937 family membrane protein [Ktedonobacteraceae bacterium]|nr:MAG: lmo0937 family membrane protein [Chloroflexota bacterium]HYT27724.1 lmo0937 family membrane protein [Ktedonobacteraceae bacterium]
MLGSLLWTIVVVLVVLWLLGFLFHVAGGLIHILLVIALIVLIYNLVVGSRARRL